MFKLSEKVFAIAMLFYTTGALFPFLAGDQNRYSTLQGNTFNLVLELIFYAGAFWFMAHQWKTVIRGAKHAKWIGLLLLVAIASAAWSQDPFFTLRRSLVLLATTAFGVYFGSRFTVPQQLRLLAWTCALVVCCSFAIAIVLPRYGVDHFLHPGDWQGAFTQKNMLARVMVLAVLVFYFAKRSLATWARWMGLVGAFTLLVLSRSVTGAIVFTAICATVPLYRLLRTRITFALPVIVAVGVATLGSAVAVASSLSDILQLVNRSPRLTGRTDLWGAVMTAIMKHPWLGYGFDGFWQGLQGESASVLQTVGWPALHSHNGFLDLTLDLGILGLIVFAVGYFSLVRRALHLIADARGDAPIWLCTYLAFMFLYNLSESSILVDNNICWILYTSTAVSLALYVPVTRTQTEIAVNHER